MPCFFGDNATRNKKVADEIVKLMKYAKEHVTEYPEIMKEINGGHTQLSIEQHDLGHEFYKSFVRNAGNQPKHRSGLWVVGCGL